MTCSPTELPISSYINLVLLIFFLVEWINKESLVTYEHDKVEIESKKHVEGFHNTLDSNIRLSLYCVNA